MKLTYKELKNKIMGCRLGKNVGGTLNASYGVERGINGVTDCEHHYAGMHGIKNYPIGGGFVTLICEERTDASEKPKITVETDLPINVEYIWDGGHEKIKQNA